MNINWRAISKVKIVLGRKPLNRNGSWKRCRKRKYFLIGKLFLNKLDRFSNLTLIENDKVTNSNIKTCRRSLIDSCWIVKFVRKRICCLLLAILLLNLRLLYCHYPIRVNYCSISSLSWFSSSFVSNCTFLQVLRTFLLTVGLSAAFFLKQNTWLILLRFVTRYM